MGEPVDPTMEAASAGPARPSGLAAGVQIGGYTLRAVIGEGGMGVVWSAHDPDLDRTLAIKLLRHDRAAPALRRRLLREARAMARLKHPNVLTVYEVGTDGERDYIAMELVDGGNLDAWLATHPQRDDVIAAVIAAGRGLAAAHAAGLVHRDFKPLNVLRSRDGRVLVTDFGLARGVGEEGGHVEVPGGSGGRTAPQMTAAAPLDETMAATPPRPTDSVLDSPMTETGALIGTPAYMAPEQYVGEPPEPRTDQFAYCVSVWQALTGARPFQGKTLAELRAAACSGVEEIECDLPPAVRAALARGLDADPAKRWPDMDALLDELARVTRPAPRRGWWWAAVPAIAAVVTLVLILVLARRDKAMAVPGCIPADKAYAEAWSPALRHDAPERIADSLDRYAKQWTGAYAHACELRVARSVECLLALRDRAAAFAHGLAAMHGELEPETVLAPPGVCAGAAPPSVPAVPPEALSALGAAYALRVDPSDDSVPSAWKPLAAYVAANAGLGYLRRHEVAKAREALARASGANALHDARLEAEIRLGQYELAVGELEHPEQAKQELQRLHTYARAAVKAAGEDAELDGWLAWIEARRTRGREAVALAVQAKRRFDEAGDLRRCALAGAFEAQLQLAHGEDAAYDEARFAVRAADEALERGRLPHEPAVDAVRGALAFANGDIVDAHERFDRIAAEARPANRWPVHKGRVVDLKGAPAAGARVVAWTGALLGDRERAYTDARRVHGGEIAVASGDGTFAIHAPPGAAIVAELGDARAAPQLVGAGPIAIALAPTQAIAGSATGRVPGLEAFAQVAAGPASWLVRAPVGKDGAFKLERVPRGTVTVGLIGPAGGGVRRVQGKHWPGGANVVEIVSRTAGDGATAWLFREGAPPAPRTRGEAEGQVMRAADVTIAALVPIGGDATDAGRQHYAPGARHALLTGVPDGAVTVCVASDAAPASRVACKTFAVAKVEGDAQAVLVDGAE